MNGAIVHFEIPADDVERAKAFYGKAFGWKIQSFPGFDYHMVQTTPSGPDGRPTTPGGINGGMLKRQAPVERPVVTVNVADMEEALREVPRLGGSVVRGKEPVGDMGWAAYVKDTEGNVVGLWQSKA